MHSSESGRITGVLWDSTSLFIAFEKAYYSIKGEVLYDILTEVGIPMKLG
jgi:hypothetical protein